MIDRVVGDRIIPDMAFSNVLETQSTINITTELIHLSHDILKIYLQPPTTNKAERDSTDATPILIVLYMMICNSNCIYQMKEPMNKRQTKTEAQLIYRYMKGHISVILPHCIFPNQFCSGSAPSSCSGSVHWSISIGYTRWSEVHYIHRINHIQSLLHLSKIQFW